MATLPASEPSEPTSEPQVIDLSAIAEKYPGSDKVMVLDLNTFDASKLTLLEVLDMCDVAGVEIGQFASLLGSSSSPTAKLTGRSARLLYGVGWVIARRQDPDLTFAEVTRWKMEIRGKMSPKVAEDNRKRAIALVNAARLTGQPSDKVGDIEMGHLQAYQQGQRKRRVRKR